MSLHRSYLLRRQIFNTQANRNFVRSALFSERRVSLLHFDRSGLKHTELFDIHEHPVDFVRVILGLTYPAPKILGFDESITFEWAINELGKRERCGFVTTRNAKGRRNRLKIKGLVPCFQRRDLTGRGTTCWDVIAEDEHGNEVVYLMKESWRTESRTPEEVFLEIAKGLEGVGQMISCEEVISTANLRGPKVLADAGFNNRVKCRTILEKYGGPVYEFQTELQLFCAFKDAIRGELVTFAMYSTLIICLPLGHRGLLSRQVLHRDVSINNILLGKLRASVGWRGILIDLDMGILIDRDPDTVAADARTVRRTIHFSIA
jgi:Fungal protein kinase